jgi:hypothetical protein
MCIDTKWSLSLNHLAELQPVAYILHHTRTEACVSWLIPDLLNALINYTIHIRPNLQIRWEQTP